MVVINLYGGPCAGKSTMAAQLFGYLKSKGVEAEYVQEYAKDLVYEERNETFSDQIYIFGKQHRRINRTANKVRVVITDSPLLLSIVYGKGNTPESFDALVADVYNMYANIDIFVERSEDQPYETGGRIHTEKEAQKLDDEILKVIRTYSKSKKLDYVEGSNQGFEDLVRLLREDYNIG